jgi:hypothetical protein
MTAINRYTCVVSGLQATAHAAAHPDGEYVLVSDYDALLAERDTLRGQCKALAYALDMIACHPIRHDPQGYAVVRGIAESALAAYRAEAPEKGGDGRS